MARLVHGTGIPVGIPWETSHGMGWDRHKLLWDRNGTDKYVPWTTLEMTALLWSAGMTLRLVMNNDAR